MHKKPKYKTSSANNMNNMGNIMNPMGNMNPIQSMGNANQMINMNPIGGMNPMNNMNPMNPMNNMNQMNPTTNMNPMANSNLGSQQHLAPPQPYFQNNETLGDLNPMPFQVDPYAPQGQYQPDPYAPQQINQGIQMGFDQFFFNASDPNIAKTNVPRKMESSMHEKIIISTIILLAGVIGGIVVIIAKPDIWNYGIIAIGGGFVAYLIMSITCSTIRKYISNLKKFDDYKQTYDKMVKGRGYFHFWIQCYHYTTTKSKKGRSSRKKVVTHTASQNFFPNMSIDQSGNIEGIKDIKKYIFVNYLKKYYFSDTRSDTVLKNAYSSFITRNRRDQYQNHTNTFQIEGFEPEVGFCMQGQSPHNKVIFYLLTFLGLALPYSCILQRSVSRYEVNILKKLTY